MHDFERPRETKTYLRYSAHAYQGFDRRPTSILHTESTYQPVGGIFMILFEGRCWGERHDVCGEGMGISH